jgi:hypothetical protein
MVRHVVDGPLSGPALGVNAGVYHQATGAPHLKSQTAKIVVGVILQAHLQAQVLSIERPALGKGGELGVAAKARQRVQFRS